MLAESAALYTLVGIALLPLYFHTVPGYTFLNEVFMALAVSFMRCIIR
jgi:hypothetical protein